MTEADDLAAALLSPEPLLALGRLALHDPALLAVQTAAERRLGRQRLPSGSVGAQLLLAIAGRPGLSAAELALVIGQDTAAPGQALVRLGLASSSRFERADCWSQTALGAAEARRLREEAAR